LEKVPPPSIEDEALRAKRIPMTGADRKLIIKQYLPGVIAFIAIYLFATIFRDIRDNFSADMWKEMGYAAKPSTFSDTEIPITIFILFLIGAVVAVKYSFKAFMIAHVFILIGFVKIVKVRVIFSQWIKQVVVVKLLSMQVITSSIGLIRRGIFLKIIYKLKPIILKNS
jgi:hypothetical protein